MGQTISDCTGNRENDHINCENNNDIFGRMYIGQITTRTLKYTDFIDNSDLYVSKKRRKRKKRRKKYF